MIRRFVTHTILGILAAWVGSVFIPNVHADDAPITFLLFGLLLAVGEVAIRVLHGPVALLFFFVPRSLRLLALRLATVSVAASLTAGFWFDTRIFGLLGFTVLLSVVYWLPPAR